jgi:hypothetical protein
MACRALSYACTPVLKFAKVALVPRLVAISQGIVVSSALPLIAGARPVILAVRTRHPNSMSGLHA